MYYDLSLMAYCHLISKCVLYFSSTVEFLSSYCGWFINCLIFSVAQNSCFALYVLSLQCSQLTMESVVFYCTVIAACCR